MICTRAVNSKKFN